MKILVVGDYKERPSEGMEVITHALVKDFKMRGNNVTTMTTKSLIARVWLLAFSDFEVVIFTHGPGLGVLVSSLLIRVFTRAKIAWVASRPSLEVCPKWLMSISEVDFIFTGKICKHLSYISQRSGAKYVNTIIGIDYDRVSGETEKSDTSSLKSNSSSFLCVHVGHIRENRGLEKLIEIKSFLKEEVEIVVIASPSLSYNKDLYTRLTKGGVVIRREFVKSMADIYREADLYLFPADPLIGGAVNLPLSVIESLLNKTPVLSTPFGVLPESLGTVGGIVFTNYSSFSDVAIDMIRGGNLPLVSSVPSRFDLKELSLEILNEVNYE